ncbi:hypothetical protein Tco_0704354 [Tanacetum coccineum]|uniref:Reverse transcriptase domain-containing protein n=1 Tax=Tanacetum coccineum TaxID=301880 RepID=A0ABQ4Y344_9ASTR
MSRPSCLDVSKNEAKKEAVYVVQIVLWVVGSGCSKHMTGRSFILRNYTEKSCEPFTLEMESCSYSVYGDFIYMAISLYKCLSDEDLIIPFDEVRIDEKLHFIEEPIEIMDREVKQLKQSRIPIVKVRWNSSRGPEYTWEREDQMWKKYPHLFDFNKKRARK